MNVQELKFWTGIFLIFFIFFILSFCSCSENYLHCPLKKAASPEKNIGNWKYIQKKMSCNCVMMLTFKSRSVPFPVNKTSGVKWNPNPWIIHRLIQIVPVFCRWRNYFPPLLFRKFSFPSVIYTCLNRPFILPLLKFWQFSLYKSRHVIDLRNSTKGTILNFIYHVTLVS